VIVLDTTVLVYAVGAEHRFREPCRELVRAIRDGETTATTTVEVIQEFAHVRARRRDRTDAVELANDYTELLSPLLIVEETDLREGLRLFAGNERLGSFDAVLAAAAHAAGADALVSADDAFASTTAITHVIPDDDGVRNLLAQGDTPRAP
jgi:predicted nucleic acid-binding protein